MIVFVDELLTTTAMGFYETEIAKVVVLALFVPRNISNAGNSGGQGAAGATRRCR